MGIAQGDALTHDQVLALTACMLSTAQVDGVQPKELALIQNFYDGCGVTGLPPFASIGQVAGTDQTLAKAAATGDTDFAEQLVLLCLATGYADGALSAAERSHVNQLAASAGVADVRVAQLLQQVKDSLLGALSHLPDAQSVALLAKEL
jgi:hypothetical protein